MSKTPAEALEEEHANQLRMYGGIRDCEALAQAAIEASPELKRLRERVAELESKLRLAANNLLYSPHSEELATRAQTHVCGLQGYDPMRDELCPGCNERFK